MERMDWYKSKRLSAYANMETENNGIIAAMVVSVRIYYPLTRVRHEYSQGMAVVSPEDDPVRCSCDGN